MARVSDAGEPDSAGADAEGTGREIRDATA
jgi:hypothetical protein